MNDEDLIMIEDKFNKLSKNIQEQNINFENKSCDEWWNFYFNCNLKGNLKNLNLNFFFSFLPKFNFN